MQLRARNATKSVLQITQVLKTKKDAPAIRKVTKRTTTSSARPAPTIENGHPLETKEDVRQQTPQPSEDPTLATLTSPNSHRHIYIPHSELHATFLQQATDHLVSVDSRFKELLAQNKCHPYSPEGLKEGVDPFKALVCGILSQQVSGAAARSITKKFILLFSEPDDEGNPPADFFPTPQQVLPKAPEVLRTAGLSGRKVEYVLDLSARFADGRLKAEDMIHDSDEEIIEKLVEVRGIGKWSAEMFLMFALKRPDVLSTGDLGIQRGMAVWAGKNIASAKGKTSKWKYMSEQEMLEEGEKWKPYRSLGAWAMWRVEGPISAPVAP